MMTASAAMDSWVYDAAYQVYYHATSQTYAIPDATTGEWSYLPASDFRPGEPSSQSKPGKGEMEEGEMVDDVGWGGLMEPEELEKALKGKSSTTSVDEKHPAYSYDDPEQYAWRSREPTPPPKEMPKEILRLVVMRSGVLEPGQVAVIDAREGGVQLGRDRGEKGGQARVRLKEMEVSKTHALVYWGSGSRGGAEEDAWWVVDLGSTHGTFIQSHSSKENVESKATRISEAKSSSAPHRLEHLSTVTIGSTTFEAHIHPSWPCVECKITGENEIRLDDGMVKEVKPEEVTPANYAMDSKERRENRELKRKREMAALKESLLNPGRPTQSSASECDRVYIDRSAMRRKLHPPSPPPRDRSRAPDTPPAAVMQSEPAPSKFAMAMLANQGWAPGTGLGRSGDGRPEPVQVELRTEKRGLGAEGSKAVVDVGEGDWRQRGKQRRYNELRNAES